MRTSSHLVTAGAAVVIAFTGMNGAAVAKGTDACRQSTQAAFGSCQAEARADQLTATGRCSNIVDPAVQQGCLDQAKTDTQDARQLCKDQHGLRKAVCTRLGPAPYSPLIDPANFTASTTIDNPFFPLKPGKTFVYEGDTADGFEHVEFAVTQVTKVILGVTCVEVHDQRQVAGKLLEDTLDWFAQDNDGNVWYFGENTAVLDEDGFPADLAGSWRGGVDGAQPGIIMKAAPAIGNFYRQEFFLQEAEDLAEVISTTASESVPFGTFDNNLVETEESSPLAPGDVEHKFYAKDVGNILTIDMAVDPPERSELIQILTAP